MAKIVKVLATWLGARTTLLPNTFQYFAIAKFEEDKDSWEADAWSVVLEFSEPPAKQGNPSIGTARFLVDNAPEERLINGKTFEMYEGRMKVAEVKILPD